jgi:hypothetical protein
MGCAYPLHWWNDEKKSDWLFQPLGFYYIIIVQAKVENMHLFTNMM